MRNQSAFQTAGRWDHDVEQKLPDLQADALPYTMEMVDAHLQSVLMRIKADSSSLVDTAMVRQSHTLTHTLTCAAGACAACAILNA